MIATLLFAGSLAARTIALAPTDDVWVYPHASDPQKDAYLRVWGADGDAVAKSADEADNYSYSFLQWDLSSLPAGVAPTGAKLVLTSIADPKYTDAQARKFPLQVRAMPSGFSEKTWKYDSLGAFYPVRDDKAVYGAGFPDPFPKAGEEFTISVDLLKGPGNFSDALLKAEREGKPLATALTSALDVTINADVQTLYKVYSKDNPSEKVRPTLILTFN